LAAGLCPNPLHGEAYSAPTDLLCELRGAAGDGNEKMEGKGRNHRKQTGKERLRERGET